jgi:hypothetical protein
MNKETALQILRNFLDHSRENLSHPFSQELSIGKYLCATDATTIVLIPETKGNAIENVPGILPPNINGILKDFSNPTSLNFIYLKSLYDEISIIERYRTVECESCDGQGKFSHYSYYYDCKECDETGKIETTQKEKVKDPNTVMLFKDCIISTKKIEAIFFIQKFISEPIELKILYSDRALTWFQINDIIIGIAALSQLDDKVVKEWKIIKVV